MTRASERLNARKKGADAGGGHDRVAKHRALGRLTARERLDAFFDPGSFVELDSLVQHRVSAFGLAERKPPGDGVVTGFGTVEGRSVVAFAQDATVFGGALGEAHAGKIVKAMENARKAGVPIVGFNDSGGARIQEGVMSLGGYGEVFLRNVLLSGVVPQISIILGPCAGGAVYSPAITDFVVMVRGQGQMFITGPEVIAAVTGESVSMEELGGAETHGTRSGVSHFTAGSEREAIALVHRLLSYLPLNNLEDPPLLGSREPSAEATRTLGDTVPEDPNTPYDVREVLSRVLDPDSLLEVHAGWAANLLVGFARLGGRSIGVVANQPKVLAGTLDIDASTKGARFVRFCDAFNIPLLTFVDVPGFLPGTAQEYGGIIRHGAKLLYAFAEASVPKLTVILRKAYGGAYDVMCSKHLGGDFNVAWPQAEIAVMGAEGAVNILFKRELEKAPEGEREALRRAKVAEYSLEFLNPYLAAERGYLDDVIHPSETRGKLLAALALLAPKREERPARKHGNLPL
ncbi:MAG: acyl-CoA carboxylase subunit beta [Thermoplasmata archaeon]|nr:acyl-CoA carboxylase subunit beta [Thermoplasmata archaeon]